MLQPLAPITSLSVVSLIAVLGVSMVPGQGTTFVTQLPIGPADDTSGLAAGGALTA